MSQCFCLSSNLKQATTNGSPIDLSNVEENCSFEELEFDYFLHSAFPMTNAKPTTSYNDLLGNSMLLLTTSKITLNFSKINN